MLSFISTVGYQEGKQATILGMEVNDTACMFSKDSTRSRFNPFAT